MGREDVSGARDTAASGHRITGDGGLSRVVAYVATACWAIVLLAGLGYGVLVQLYGDAYCEPFEGSSQYGDLGWSALPPGPTCSFTVDVHGFDEVRGPYPVMSAWLLALAVGGLVCIILLRRSRMPEFQR